jgi:hypothetical protein
MIKTFILLALFVTLGMAPGKPAAALQDTPALDTHLAVLEVDLRPEFDKPDMLVIYHLVLAADEKLPATLTVRIPARVEKPTAVQAVDSMDGSLTSLPYTIISKENWLYITFMSATSEINFEYHDPLLNKEDSSRSYQFLWAGDYQIDNLSIYIQEPIGAKRMMVSPSLGSPKVGDNGITYHYSMLGELTLGTGFSIGIQYEKETDELSLPQLAVQPSGNLDESTPGRVTMMELFPWLVGFALILIIAGGFWWLWVIRHSPDQKRRHFHHRMTVGRKKDDHIYCHECGQRAERGDIFCRICGSRLRLS